MGAHPAPVEADAADCAANRVRFLTAGHTAPDSVRPAIRVSWRRSAECGVAADRVAVPYVHDPEADTLLTRSSAPVLDKLAERLAGQPVSIILTDADGLVLRRRTLDAEFERRLDSVLLAPGFSYAERFAGTNGIGTALESGRATQVLGHEHYAENLETFACAAVPIRDPTTRRRIGALDLTVRRKDTDTLLLTLAEATAEQIERELVAAARRDELALVHAFRQACRRTSGIVLAVGAGAVTLNDRAVRELAADDQAALLARAGERRTRRAEVQLPSGARARVSCRPVGAGDAGVVLVVRPVPAAAPPPPVLPGVVGTTAAWWQVVAQVDAAVADGAWLAISGEPGTGKRTLVEAVLSLHGRRHIVLDARAADQRWSARLRAALASHDAVVLAHADELSPTRLRQLRELTATSTGCVAVTLAAQHPELAFASQVEVPPLRLRTDDLPALFAHLLQIAGHGVARACAPEAMRVLLHASWPGNVAQLLRVAEHVARRSSSGIVTVADLPPDVHADTRRVLSPLESLERDAIVAALAAAGGRKADAAHALGMSRATIYRRIRDYGLASCPSSAAP